MRPGWVMSRLPVERFPALEVWVHADGLPHLADPAKLVSSARRLYGDDMDRLWGPVRPVPGRNLRRLDGGEAVRLGDRKFEVTYAATGRGTMTHLTGELLKSRAGIDVLAVPYTGGAPQALNDALGGRLSMVIEGLSALSGAIQGGSMKAIAVGSPERLPDFPNLPAAAEVLPGFNARGWAALVAPVGTPDAIVNKVSDALGKVVGETEVQKKLAATGSYVRPMSPGEVMAFIQADQQMWKPILERIAANP